MEGDHREIIDRPARPNCGDTELEQTQRNRKRTRAVVRARARGASNHVAADGVIGRVRRDSGGSSFCFWEEDQLSPHLKRAAGATRLLRELVEGGYSYAYGHGCGYGRYSGLRLLRELVEGVPHVGQVVASVARSVDP